MASLEKLPGVDRLVASERTALIVWDMQRGIAPRAKDYRRLVGNTSSLVTAARSAGVLTIWSRHGAPPLRFASPAWIWTLMRRQRVRHAAKLKPYLEVGSEETRFVSELEPAADELVIDKTTPSLFVGTPAETFLRARTIQTIVLCGVATDQGVEFTARHALALGFLVVVAEDAVGSFTVEAHERGLAFLREAATVMPTKEITARWLSSA